jgi:hypothetical protein
MLACGDKSGGAGDADAKGDDKAIATWCKVVRIQTNGHASKLEKRSTREKRGDSDAAFMADLAEQAKISKELADELKMKIEIPELKKLVDDIAAHHDATHVSLNQMVEAVKAGDKAKENELAAASKASAAKQDEVIDKFEAYCAAHGAPSKP